MEKNFSKVFGILILLCFINSLFVYETNDNKKIKHIIKDSTNVIKDTMKLNKHNLEYVVYNTFKDSSRAEIVIKQIYLESGHLKSKLCTENNNLTGMKHPRIRETKSLKEKNGYAYFKSWQKCVEDAYIYQKENKLLSSSKKEYLNFLKRKYSEDKNYLKKLISIYTLKVERTKG